MTLAKTIALASLGGILLANSSASADDTIRLPGARPNTYSVEIEPKLDFGDWGYYGNDYFGAGLRISIPVIRNGPIETINNNIAIGFGLDYLSWGCDGCSAGLVEIPIVAQWNFFLARQWSVFVEAGPLIHHAFWNCGPGVDCGSDTGVTAAVYLGGRYHISDKVALTGRLGYPEASLGLSFYP